MLKVSTHEAPTHFSNQHAFTNLLFVHKHMYKHKTNDLERTGKPEKMPTPLKMP